MSKRNTVSVTILSAFGLTLCLFSAVITAQKAPQGTASSVRGIDVIVRKNPGNTAVRTVTTDDSGRFSFPIMPAGPYSVTLSRSKLFTDKNGEGTIEKARQASPAEMPVTTCSITILGAEGGTKTEDWNLETNRIIIKSHNGVATRTTPGEDRINVVSDGKTPLTGTISKSRSNVKANN